MANRQPGATNRSIDISSSGALGQDAERAALKFLRTRGLSLIARNFRCRVGELDLVMLSDDVVVFAEVRRRRGRQFGSAAASVDARKQRKLVRAAAFFLAKNPKLAHCAVRFDVIGIDGNKPTIEWIPDAFRPGDFA